MKQLKIFAGYISATKQELRRTHFAKAALYTIRESQAEALRFAKEQAFLRYPARLGWSEQSCELIEIEGVTVPADKVRR